MAGARIRDMAGARIRDIAERGVLMGWGGSRRKADHEHRQREVRL